MKDLLQYVSAGDPISAQQYNLLIDIARSLGRSTNCYIDRNGVHIRTPRNKSVSDSNMRYGIITGAANSTSVYSVSLQPMKLSAAGPPPVYIKDGGVIPAMCWPGSNAADFFSHVSNAEYPSTAVYVLYMTIDDDVYVFPTYLFYSLKIESTVKRTDCVVA